MNQKLINIKIVGKGCVKYFELLKIVQDKVIQDKIPNSVEEINDPDMIVKLGVTKLPALIVNNKIIVQGTDFQRNKVYTALEVK